MNISNSNQGNNAFTPGIKRLSSDEFAGSDKSSKLAKENLVPPGLPAAQNRHLFQGVGIAPVLPQVKRQLLAQSRFPLSDMRSFFQPSSFISLALPSSSQNSLKTSSEENSKKHYKLSNAHHENNSVPSVENYYSAEFDPKGTASTEVCEEEGSSDGGSISSTEVCEEDSVKGNASKERDFGTSLKASEHIETATQSASTPSFVTQPLFNDHGVFIRTEVEEVPASTSLGIFLEKKGVNRSNVPFGNGSCGKVYNATIQGSTIPYVCKVETRPMTLSNWGEKFWRYSDLAVSRLDDLPHVVKPLFFILRVTEAPQGAQKLFYVPASKAKEFGQALPAGSKVQLVSQVVEKAPGKNLQQLLDKGEISLDPQSPHFRTILLGVSKFLKKAYPSNFIHRDLKPENIMYDPSTGKVTIIDTGISMRLRSRGKTDAQTKGPSNPVSAKKPFGTPHYSSPFVLQENNYGSEIDFHSTAMLLLTLINNKDFGKFSKTEKVLFSEKAPKDFLEHYCTVLGAESPTVKTLAANPDVREIIDLAFQVSAGGSAGEAALQRFEQLPYFAAS